MTPNTAGVMGYLAAAIDGAGHEGAIQAGHEAREGAERCVLTPRGEAVLALIRAGWLRELAPGAQTAAIHGLAIGIADLTDDDRAYLTSLVSAHQ